MSRTLIHRDPFADLTDLRGRFARMMDEVAIDGERGWLPATDVIRDEENLTLRVDIPGIKPEEVKIEVQDDVLTMSGEHEESTEEKDKHFVRRERRYGAFSRSMTLPPGVDAAKIEAKTHDGVLEVRIPLAKTGKKETVQITPAAG